MPSDNLQIVVHKLEEGDWTTRSNRRQQGKAHKGWVPQVQVTAPPPPQQQLQAMPNITFAPVQVGPTPITAVAPVVAAVNPPVVNVQMANPTAVQVQNAAQNGAITRTPQATTAIQHVAGVEGQVSPQGRRHQARVKTQTTQATNVVVPTARTPVDKNPVTLAEQAPVAGRSATSKSSNKAPRTRSKATRVVAPSTTTPTNDMPVDKTTTSRVKAPAPSKTTKAAGLAKGTKDMSITSASTISSVNNNTAVPSATSAPANVAPGRDATPSTKASSAPKSTQAASSAKNKGDTSATAAAATAATDSTTPTDRASTIVNLNPGSTNEASTNATTAVTPQSTANRPSRSLPKRATTNQETSSIVQKAGTSDPQCPKTTEKASAPARSTPRKSNNPATSAKASDRDTSSEVKERTTETTQTAPVPKASAPITNAPSAQTLRPASPVKVNDYHKVNVENELELYPTTPNSRKRKADSELTAAGIRAQRPRDNLVHYPLAPQQETPRTGFETILSEVFDMPLYEADQLKFQSQLPQN